MGFGLDYRVCLRNVAWYCGAYAHASEDEAMAFVVRSRAGNIGWIRRLAPLGYARAF